MSDADVELPEPVANYVVMTDAKGKTNGICYLRKPSYSLGAGDYELVAASQLRDYGDRRAAAEREACALVCDVVQTKNEGDGQWLWEAKTCAAAIRARGEK